MRLDMVKGRRRAVTVSLITILALTFFVGLGLATMRRFSSENPAATVKVSTATIPPAERGYSMMLKQVLPAVVNISSTKILKPDVREFESGPGVDPFFRQFFGDDFFKHFAVPRAQREKSLGSGVLVSQEGYILTNDHVVDHANEVLVTLRDKRELNARVVGTDSRTDIAVLKVAGSNFPYLQVADSSKLSVGDIVLAIGDPFGVGQTVTQGIVSALGRSGLGIEQVEDFIQTDAPINPGNSGGALVDVQGRLIGINTAILGNSGGSQGIGFAVPINMARYDMDQIIARGKVEHGYMGILPQDVTPALARSFHVDPKGALVGDVTPGSPAAKANLKVGDIIVDVDGKPIEDANQLRLRIGMMAPGSEARLSVLRDGKPLTLTVNLGEFPTEQQQASLEKDHSSGALHGVTVENITPDVAQEMNLPAQTKGVVVEDVNPASRAAEAGLQPGDVIEQINRAPVRNTRDFSQAMTSVTANGPVLLLIERDGNTMFLSV